MVIQSFWIRSMVSQFIYMLLLIVAVHRSYGDCMCVWAWCSLAWCGRFQANKAKKIEIVMSQIKSTKRLTIDNVQEIFKHTLDAPPVRFKRKSLEEHGVCVCVFLPECLWAKIKSSPHLTPRIMFSWVLQMWVINPITLWFESWSHQVCDCRHLGNQNHKFRLKYHFAIEVQRVENWGYSNDVASKCSSELSSFQFSMKKKTQCLVF